MEKLPYAEDMNYWQTGKSLPDTWIENARKEIEAIGGKINSWAFGSETQTGRSAYMMQFEVGGEKFKIIFPVLPTRSKKNEASARIQAATMLYHDVKSKCMIAKIFGARSAFFAYLLLGDGTPLQSVSNADLQSLFPEMFSVKQLTDSRR